MYNIYLLKENHGKDDKNEVKNPYLKEIHSKIAQSADRVADVLIQCRININKVMIYLKYRAIT
jgi:hypothetical protein